MTTEPKRKAGDSKPNKDLIGADQVGPARWMVSRALLLLVMVVVAYLPAMRGQFIWDDDAHVTKPELRSAHGLYRVWFEVGATQQYYPLLHSAFWVEHKLWGDRPCGYHLLNIALHACAAVLVMSIMRRLLNEKSPAWADEAAFLTAAVFALHPVHVESVAWISEQKNTLSAVFYLAAMLAYLRFDRERRPFLYITAVALFAMGLLTKTITATLPAALLVILWWQRGRLSWKRDAFPLVPWFILGIGSGLFTTWVEHELIGAKGQAFDFGWVQRLMLVGRIVCFYLCELAWPAELIFMYPRWTVNPTAWVQWLFPLGLVLLVIALAALSRKSRAPLAALLFFIGSLSPVLGLFNVYPFLYSFVADHFQYLPSLGIISLICGVMAASASRVPWRAGRATLLLALPVALGILTFRQCRMYADVQTLYEATIQKNPTCWMAHNNLGVVLKNKGRRDEAIEHYRRALQLRPDYPEAHNNLGIVLNAMGQHDEAIAAYREALRLRPANPDALSNMAIALTDSGRYQEAISCLERALRYDPQNAALHGNLGETLATAGRLPEAIVEYRRAMELNPNQPGVQLRLIGAMANGQAPERTIAAYEQVLRTEPDNAQAHFALAVVLADHGRIEQAIEHYQHAIRINPSYMEARNNLATILARAGRLAEAIPHFEEAVRLKPDHVETWMNLAVAYSSAGRIPGAISAAQAARDLAYSSGQPALVREIESWMETRRAGITTSAPGQ
jgi:protein O-mannosyl-transferase